MAAVGLLGVGLSLATTGCDSSPVAARINTQVIKQAALDQELAYWAADKTYVSAFDSSNSSNSGGTGVTVAGAGPGTYNNTWVANILNNMVSAAAIRQSLTANNDLPDQAMTAAARSVLEFGQYGWYSLPLSLRNSLTERLADQSQASAPTVSASNLKEAYQQYQQYFFTRVCVAQEIADTKYEALAAESAALPTDDIVCYGQTQFEAEPAAWRTAVLGTAVGLIAAPIATSDGYQIIQVVSRVRQGFNSSVQKVIGTVLEAQVQADSQIAKILDAAHVQINPAYGTWRDGSVQPPAAVNATT